MHTGLGKPDASPSAPLYAGGGEQGGVAMHHSFMPACLLGLIALALSAPALAQSGEAACPAPGTQLTFSDGGRIEAVGSQAGPICRMKSLRNDHSFERLFGAFDPKAKLIQANLDKISS